LLLLPNTTSECDHHFALFLVIPAKYDNLM
jgi:hypothetical protein